MTTIKRDASQRRGDRRGSSQVNKSSKGVKLPTDVETDEQRQQFLVPWVAENDSRASAFPRLGYIQMTIFLALAVLKEEHTYGARIIEWINANRPPGKPRVEDPQIYGALGKLVAEGFLKEANQRHPSGKGRFVVAYRLTSTARAALKAMLILEQAKLKPPPDG